jgi:hypothetical protein
MDRFTTPMDEGWLVGAIVIFFIMLIYWAVKSPAKKPPGR